MKTARSTPAHCNQLRTAPGSCRVCTYWLEGRCNRNPCRFLHDASLPRNVYDQAAKQSSYMHDDCPGKDPESGPVNLVSSTSTERGDSSTEKNSRKPLLAACRYWMSGNCVKGDACRFLHSWFHGVDFAMLAKLDGHKLAVSGIALPSGSTKLYSGSRDGTVRIWDCHTGQCVQVINLGGQVTCFTFEVPWVFIGMHNSVKAWNIQNGASYDMSGPVGQVHAMEVAKNMLFAGAEDGAILVWKRGSEADHFQKAATLSGHDRAVLALTIGHDRLYSGSADDTIRVWDLHTLECVQEFVGHVFLVMSLLCWDQYLISCSLDMTVKVWVATEGGSLEVVYTHYLDRSILALSGMNDACGKPVLLCAFTDYSVRLYELPSFAEKGRIFSREQVTTFHMGPGGLFFTGDATGMLTVWHWLDSLESQEEQLPHPMESC